MLLIDQRQMHGWEIYVPQDLGNKTGRGEGIEHDLTVPKRLKRRRASSYVDMMTQITSESCPGFRC